MEIRKFDINKDLIALEEFLRNNYLENKNMTSWLPERLHDLIYRMDTQYTDQGKPKSTDYIYLWIDNNSIVGCILPDGDAIYISVKNDYDYLFPSIVNYAENNCKPLFTKEEDGRIDFLIVSNDSLKDRCSYLEKNGYVKDIAEDYDNYVYPINIDVSIKLPDGFRLAYNDEYSNDVNKWSALNLAFHPDLENPNYQNNMNPYNSRKLSSMYNDSFECMVIDDNTLDNNNVAAYSFVYVDKLSSTAFIEPVGTREKYQHMGIGKAMMHGIMLKCKELGIEKCYVNSYDYRRKFYNASGFITEDSIGFWHKNI